MTSNFPRSMPLQLYIKFIKIFMQLTLKMFWNQETLTKFFFRVGVGGEII